LLFAEGAVEVTTKGGVNVVGVVHGPPCVPCSSWNVLAVDCVDVTCQPHTEMACPATPAASEVVVALATFAEAILLQAIWLVGPTVDPPWASAPDGRASSRRKRASFFIIAP